MFIKYFFFLFISSIFLWGCNDDQQRIKNELWQTCFAHYKAESYLVARQACHKASDAGIASAQWLLGHIYYYNLTNQSTSREQGFNYYLKAAENGWPEALTFVGESYLYADGVEADFEKAFVWLNKAAQYQDPNAEFALGLLFYNGNGRPKDISTAIFWFNKAAEKNHLMSINNLAWIHATSEHQTFRDIQKAQFWLNSLEQNTAEKIHQNSIFLDTKAAVYALANNFELAIVYQNEAIGLLPENVEESRLIEFQKHLEAYQNNHPWLEK